MLTVLAWLWNQPGCRTRYAAHHVNIWADMVDRHLATPHRLACVTDLPQGIDPRVKIIAPPGDFADVRIPSWPAERPQCFRRLALFRPDAAAIFGERFVSMDLDCVIGDSLDPLFDTAVDFKINASHRMPQVAYNGAMLLMTAGVRPQVYQRFSIDEMMMAGVKLAGSDQAWISHVLGSGEATWGDADGVTWYGSGAPRHRILFFPGSLKPWDRIGGDYFVTRHYRRTVERRAA
jgi:hypothetical protein